MTVTTDTPQIEVIDPISQTLDKLLKPGSKTTEFFGLVAVYAGALVALLGFFDVHNAKANAVIKVAALIAAAVSHVGYALSRGNTKQALATVTATLAAADVSIPLIAKPAKHAKDAGLTTWGLIGIVLLIVGVLMCLGAGSFMFLVFGIIVAVIGAVLAFGATGRFRL